MEHEDPIVSRQASSIFQTPVHPLDKDDNVVWRNFLKGDEQSLIYIYRKYANVLFRYGQQFSRRNEFVQDTIQELFFDLIKKRKSLSVAKSVKGYLFSSLKRKILRGIKKEERLVLDDSAFSFSYSTSILPISADLKENEIKYIFQSINQLPTNQREVIFLYFYQGLTYTDISVIMEIKVASVRKLTYRALNNLETKIKSKFK